MQKIVCKTAAEASVKAAEIFAELITNKPNCVLGLATGGTPVALYQELIKKHKENGLDFSQVTTYNLDEYYPLSRDHDQSYYYFMHEQLFNHVNIKEENINVPNGSVSNAKAECDSYDKAARDAGVDIQLLGIGINGHIAFNEPEEQLYVGTHVTGLTESTIQANARFFATADDVPKTAITMGIGTIMAAKKIVLLALGANKAAVVKEMFGGRIDVKNPATLLQLHPNVIIIVDEAANG